MERKVKVLANLDRRIYDRLAALSQRTGNPMTFYIRQALSEYLERVEAPGAAVDWQTDPLNAIVGALDHGPRDLSSTVDHYLYGRRP